MKLTVKELEEISMFSLKNINDSCVKALTLFKSRYPRLADKYINIGIRLFGDGTRQIEIHSFQIDTFFYNIDNDDNNFYFESDVLQEMN